MADDNVIIYSEEEVNQIVAQAAYLSRIETVLSSVRDELIKSDAAPVVIETIELIMVDYGILQPVEPQEPQEGQKASDEATK